MENNLVLLFICTKRPKNWLCLREYVCKTFEIVFRTFL